MDYRTPIRGFYSRQLWINKYNLLTILTLGTDDEVCTIYSQFIAIINDTIIHTEQWLKCKNFGHILHSRTTPHISTSRASYGVSIVRSSKKNDRDISRARFTGLPYLEFIRPIYLRHKLNHWVWCHACVNTFRFMFLNDSCYVILTYRRGFFIVAFILVFIHNLHFTYYWSS